MLAPFFIYEWRCTSIQIPDKPQSSNEVLYMAIYSKLRHLIGPTTDNITVIYREIANPPPNIGFNFMIATLSEEEWLHR